MERVIQQGSSALPPAGHAREAELDRRQDTLDEAGETRANKLDMHAVNPEAFKVDPELAQHFDELEVRNAQSGYVYGWVYTGLFGRYIKTKMRDGWQVVQGDMQEAIELMGTMGDTTRRLGDVILMRIRKDKKRLLDRREAEKRRRQQEGVTSELDAMGEKYAALGIKVQTPTNMSPQMLKTLESRSGAAANRFRAQGLAKNQFNEMVRTGRVPGRPAPGAK